MKDFEKILKIVESQHVTYQEIERRCGLSGGVISKMMDRKGNLHLNSSLKVQEVFSINSEWWNTGKGEMFKEKLTSVSKKEELRKNVENHNMMLMMEGWKSAFEAVKERNDELKKENEQLRAKLGILDNGGK